MPQRINSELFVRPKSALVRDQPVLLMVLGALAVCWCALHRIAWKWLIDHAATLLGLAGNMRPIPSLSSISFQLAILENYLKWSWRNTHLHILDPASMSIYAYASIAIYFRHQHPCLEATTCIKDHCHTSSNEFFVALIFFWITIEQKNIF